MPSAALFTQKMEVFGHQRVDGGFTLDIAVCLERSSCRSILVQRFRELVLTRMNERLEPLNVAEELDVCSRSRQLSEPLKLSQSFRVLGFQKAGADPLLGCPSCVGGAARIEVANGRGELPA